jgi:hypothetical protein
VPAQHDLRLHFLGRRAQAVVVDLAARRQRAIAHEVEDLAHTRHRCAVRQVTAVREIHCEDRVARLEARHVHRLIHWRAAQRLHVGVLGAEQRLGTLDRELLDAVGELLAAVVAAPWVTFRVLVGEHAAVGRVDLRERVILGWDQLDAFALPLLFALQGGIHVGIGSLDQVERDFHDGAPDEKWDECPGERPQQGRTLHACFPMVEPIYASHMRRRTLTPVSRQRRFFFTIRYPSSPSPVPCRSTTTS